MSPSNIETRNTKTIEMESRSNKTAQELADPESAEPFAEEICVQEEALARAAEAQWSWRGAIEHWDKCAATVAHKPNILALTRKAYCLIELGEIDLAREVFTSIADHLEGVKGLAVIASLQDTMRLAEARWDECATRFPDQVTGVLGKANILLQREMYQEADKLLSSTTVTWPESCQAGVLWARCATAAKNWKVAETRWKKVLDKWPSERDVRQGYIRYLAALGDRVAANSFLASLADQPVALAECTLEYHVASDDFGAAADHAAKLVELEPHILEHRLRLTGLLTRDGAEPALHAASSILKSLYRISPESVSVVSQLVEVCIRSGLDSQAQVLLQTIPSDDRRIAIEIHRAWARHRNKDEDGAKKAWDAILDRQFVPAIHAPITDLTRIDRNEFQIDLKDILLFSVIRNEHPRLDWFLNYYRKLGITKFVIVDNASSDQSVKLLLENQDVVVYQTSNSYSAAGAGMRWVNELVKRHGQRNWCLCVDADEAFVFLGQESFGLRKLVDYLDWKGYEAMLAIMLDMYPPVIDKASPASFETQQSSYVHFDNRYFIHGSPICPYREIFGGVRRRLFQGYQLANKVPLIKGASGIQYLLSSHRITPAKLAGVTAGLLHYHLIYALQPEYRSLFDEAIERREFPSNSLERLRCRELLSEITSGDSLLADDSARFETSEQLLTIGKGQSVGLPRSDDFYLKVVQAG